MLYLLCLCVYAEKRKEREKEEKREEKRERGGKEEK